MQNPTETVGLASKMKDEDRLQASSFSTSSTLAPQVQAAPISGALPIVLTYASKRLQCFPIVPGGKEPATRRGHNEATDNTATLRRWFGQGHPYNVGVRTGVASGVFVLDVDGEEGAASLCKLEAEHGRLPLTLISTTGKGRHFWFRIDSPIPCSVSKISPGIDVRGDGGYVVAPPSVHPNGKTYRWTGGATSPAPAPPWLIRLSQQTKKRYDAPIVLPRRGDRQSAAYAQAALDREVEALSRAPAGTRNHALNRASFSLHQLVATSELDAGDVVARLVDACHANGLLADDGSLGVMATIRSGARAGLQCPRSGR